MCGWKEERMCGYLVIRGKHMPVPVAVRSKT